jgi:hypothetical protein
VPPQNSKYASDVQQTIPHEYVCENKGKEIERRNIFSCIPTTLAYGKLMIEPILDFLLVGARSSTVIREPPSLARASTRWGLDCLIERIVVVE